MEEDWKNWMIEKNVAYLLTNLSGLPSELKLNFQGTKVYPTKFKLFCFIFPISQPS